MRLAILLFALLMFAHPAVFAAEPASESDAQKAVRYTVALEQAPFASDAKEKRIWLMAWLTDTKDYTVYVCGDIFGPLLKAKKPEDVPYGPELLVQQMFGNVAYQIGNPSVHDDASMQLAGMESLLKVYALVIARDAKAHMPYYDNLLAEQKKGSLKKYLTPIIQKKCTKRS
jgi:hypothetical protein